MQLPNPNALKVLVGARIKERLAGREYAEIADLLGVRPSAIGNWVRGVRLPDPQYWDGLATALTCTVDYLLARTDDPRGVEGLRLEPAWELTISRAQAANLSAAEIDIAIEFLRKMQKQEG